MDLTELQALQPETKTLTIKGEQIEVKPFKFKQLLSALKFLSNMISDINEYEDKTIQLFRLFANHPDDVIGILSLVSNREAKWFDDIESEDGIELAIAAWTVNADFFAQKVQPKLEKLGLKGSPSEVERKSELTDTEQTQTTNEPS